jgi:hypothetical protein
LSLLASLVLLSITLLLGHPSLLKELSNLDILVEMISRSQPRYIGSADSITILKNHLGYSSYLIIHLLGLLTVLLLAVGNPLDDKSILIPFASKPVSRLYLFANEFFSNLLPVAFFLFFPVPIALINSILAGIQFLPLLISFCFLGLKLVFLLLLFTFIRELSGAVVAGLLAPAIYFCSHLGSFFARLAEQLEFPWYIGALLLQIILPPLHRTGFFAFYTYQKQPVLLPLDLGIIIGFSILFLGFAYLQYQRRDLI